MNLLFEPQEYEVEVLPYCLGDVARRILSEFSFDSEEERKGPMRIMGEIE